MILVRADQVNLTFRAMVLPVAVTEQAHRDSPNVEELVNQNRVELGTGRTIVTGSAIIAKRIAIVVEIAAEIAIGTNENETDVEGEGEIEIEIETEIETET